MLKDTQMVNHIVPNALENNAKIIVENLFLIKKPIIQILLVMILEVLIIGKKMNTQELIEIWRLLML